MPSRRQSHSFQATGPSTKRFGKQGHRSNTEVTSIDGKPSSTTRKYSIPENPTNRATAVPRVNLSFGWILGGGAICSCLSLDRSMPAVAWFPCECFIYRTVMLILNTDIPLGGGDVPRRCARCCCGVSGRSNDTDEDWITPTLTTYPEMNFRYTPGMSCMTWCFV